MITDTQSYSQVIRDALFATVVQLPFFQNFKARRSKQLPIQEPILPYLGVYIIGEDMPADGDPNAGDIRFIHMLRVGFQVIIENNDPVQSELYLDQAFWAIMNGLWTDSGLTNMIQTEMPDNTRIEGIERGTRRHVWGTMGSTQEKPIGELEYIATVKYRSEWYPGNFPDLLRIHEEVVPMADDGTVPDASVVQRIIVEYEFTPQARETRNARRSARAAREADQREKGVPREAHAGVSPRPRRSPR
jgi:hypothetical protein